MHFNRLFAEGHAEVSLWRTLGTAKDRNCMTATDLTKLFLQPLTINDSKVSYSHDASATGRNLSQC